MTNTETATKSYRLTDANEVYFADSTTRRDIERAARQAALRFGGCFVVTQGDTIVALVQRDGSRVRIDRIGA